MQYLFWLRFYVPELWPFCGQYCRQFPLFAGISLCQEPTLRISQRERIDLISTTCKMVVPAEAFRLADSQSSNTGSIPVSATKPSLCAVAMFIPLKSKQVTPVR